MLNNQASNGLKPGVVVALNALSAYIPDSVVSRTLVKNDAGTVTFFAFAKGQALSQHSAPFNALVQVLDGEGVITIDEKENLVKAGELILMPANVPHAVHAEQDFKMLLIMLKG